MRWVGVLAIEGEWTEDDRLIEEGALIPWSSMVSDVGPVEEWVRRPSKVIRGSLIVGRGVGDVRRWQEVGTDLDILEAEYAGDEEGFGISTVIKSAALIGVTPGFSSGWPGRTFIAPELPSVCTEHEDRRLVCAACCPLPPTP